MDRGNGSNWEGHPLQESAGELNQIGAQAEMPEFHVLKKLQSAERTTGIRQMNRRFRRARSYPTKNLILNSAAWRTEAGQAKKSTVSCPHGLT